MITQPRKSQLATFLAPLLALIFKKPKTRFVTPISIKSGYYVLPGVLLICHPIICGSTESLNRAVRYKFKNIKKGVVTTQVECDKSHV